MPAPRDIDWTHIHVPGGDLDAAAPYVSLGRKLLGYVKHDASFNGLGVRDITRKLDDGTIVRAEIAGTIPRITIVPASQGYVREARWLEGVMICGPSTDTSPDSFIAHSVDDQGLTYYTGFFRNKDSTGYAEASHPKSTWGGVQPELAVLTVLPEYADLRAKHGKRLSYFEEATPMQIRGGYGITHVNRRGESVNWFGSVRSNYFHHPGVHAWAQSGPSVTSRGSEIFSTMVDTQTYRPWTVRGAAIRDGALYVVLARSWYAVEYPPHPDGDPAQTPYATPTGPVGPVPVQVLKVPLAEKLDPGTLHVHYRAVPGAAELLWDGDLHNADCPWVFDEDVTHAVCIARPDETRLTWTYQPDSGYDAFINNNLITPSTSHLRHHFDIGSRSMTTGDAGDVIAEDSGKTLRLERVGPADWDYVYGQQRFEAWRLGPEHLRRELVFADVRHGRFVFAKIKRKLSDGFFECVTEVVEDGGVIEKHRTTEHHEYDTVFWHWNIRVTGVLTKDEKTEELLCLRDRLSRLTIDSYALMLFRGIGSAKMAIRYTDNGGLLARRAPGLYLKPLMNEGVFGSASFDGADIGPLLYGGVAFNSRVGPSSRVDTWNVHVWPGELPAVVASVSQLHGFTRVINARDWGAVGVREFLLFAGHIRYQSTKKHIVAHVTSGDLYATAGYNPNSGTHTAVYWGKPPSSQHKRYRSNR